VSHSSPQAQALHLLGRIPLFARLNEDECYQIVRTLRPIKKPAGEVLFREGDPGVSLVIIEGGAVEVSLDANGKAEVLAALGPNEVLGEMALIDRGARSATATVVDDLSGYEISVQDFDFLRSQLDPAAYKIIRELSRVMYSRIRAVNDRIEGILHPEEAKRKAEAAARAKAEAAAAKEAAAAAEAPELVSKKAAQEVEDGFGGSVSGMFRNLVGKLWRNEDKESS